MCVFAWPKGGHVEKCLFLSVFLLGRRGKCRKEYFVCGFLAKVDKCCVFLCFWFLCALARSKGEMSKRVLFVKSVMFLHVF